MQIYDLTFEKLYDQFCYLVIKTAFDFGVFPTGRSYRQKTKYRQKRDCVLTSVNHAHICQDKPSKELCTIAFRLYLILVALIPVCCMVMAISYALMHE